MTIRGNNNAPVNKITVEVKGDAGIDEEFDFWIEVKGVGKLDPRVRVVGSSTIENLRAQDFYDTLDTLDLTLEDANKLIPPRAESE